MQWKVASGEWKGRWELKSPLPGWGALGTFPIFPTPSPGAGFLGGATRGGTEKLLRWGGVCMGAQGLPLPYGLFLAVFTPAWKGGCLSRGLGEMEARWTTCCLPTPHHELAPVPPLQARGCGGGTASPLRAFVSIKKRIPFLKTLSFQLPENCPNKYTNWPPL